LTGDEIAQLSYLALLGTAVAGWFFMQNRQSVSKLSQQAVIWGLIFVGVIASYGLWSDISERTLMQQSYKSDTGEIRVPVSKDGHYYLTLLVNGIPVRFAVDTGASEVVLTRKDAKRIGLNPESLNYMNAAHTANGIVYSAPVRLKTVTLGPITDTNLRAEVNAGEMRDSLLGMTYLSRFENLSFNRGFLVLKR